MSFLFLSPVRPANNATIRPALTDAKSESVNNLILPMLDARGRGGQNICTGATMEAIANLGRRVQDGFSDVGDFAVFCARTLVQTPGVLANKTSLHMLMRQFFEIGTRSLPVVMVTGAFVGMVLAVQTVPQFAAMDMPALVGSVVNHSVLKELGPVLVGVLLAGRVGGGLAAELGTMRVTEQIDALRAMGCDPIRVLIAPRFLACLLLMPLLVMYACFTGIVGGCLIAVYVYGINAADFWWHSQATIGLYEILYGPLKGLFFGAIISLIACYKGFRCAPGAAGVGRACTESFVASCMAILTLDLFLGMFLNTLYRALYGAKELL